MRGRPGVPGAADNGARPRLTVVGRMVLAPAPASLADVLRREIRQLGRQGVRQVMEGRSFEGRLEAIEPDTGDRVEVVLRLVRSPDGGLE